MKKFLILMLSALVCLNCSVIQLSAEEDNSAAEPEAGENVSNETPVLTEQDNEEPANEPDQDSESESTKESAGETETLPKEPEDDNEVLSPEEFEVEEGVFHGFIGGEYTALGVYDTDYPVIKEFEVVENGKSLKPGDVVHFRAKVTDDNGVNKVEIRISDSYSGNSHSENLSLNYNDASGYWETSWEIPDDTVSGHYSTVYLRAADTYGFYTTYSSNSRRVMQRLLPGSVTILGKGEEEPEPSSEIPDQFAFAETGKALHPGDTLHISFDLPKGMNLSSLSMWIYGPNGFSLRYNSYDPENSAFVYDSETGHVTGSYQLTENDINGLYYLSSIDVNGYFDDGTSYSQYWSLPYREYRFTITGAMEEKHISISEFVCDENGMTLTDGDTVHFRFRVNAPADATDFFAHIYLGYYEAYDSSYGTGVRKDNNVSVSIDPKLNETTGLWEGSYTFRDEDVYGMYYVDRVYISCDSGKQYISTNYEDSGVMVLFAEKRTESYKRLSPVVDPVWSEEGLATVTLPADHLGKCTVRFFSEDGDGIGGVTYNSISPGVKKLSVDDFQRSKNVTDGRYYFTATMLGDGKEYYDSEPVRSGYFEYRTPDKQLGKAVDLTWIAEEGRQYKNGVFRIPAGDSDFLRGYEYSWYYSETEKGTPYSCGMQGSRNFYEGQDKTTGSAWMPDSLIQTYGNGWYYYRVRLTSSNILKCRNGEWTQLSAAYHLTGAAESIINKLQDVETYGKNPQEIRDQVHEIPTEDLRKAMMSDENVAEEIRKLEAAVGSGTDVHVTREGIGGTVKAVGAGLNDVAKEGKVTLNVGYPAKEHVLPAMYDNTVAFAFSMGLDNVKNTKQLKVPVLIDMPIPEDIEPSFLMVLHYHNDGSLEYINPYVYRAGNIWYAQFTVTGFSDFVLTQKVKTTEGIHVAGLNENYVYTGSAIKPEVQVYDGGILLAQGTDYSLSYKNNTKVGTATLTVTGKGSYTAKKTLTFQIVPVDLNEASVQEISFAYTGKKLNVKPTVTWNGKPLKLNSDYNIDDYGKWDQISSGVHEITLAGTGNFNGKRNVKVSVTNSSQVSVAKLKVTAKAVAYKENLDFEKDILPGITVAEGKTVLTKGEHYEITPDAESCSKAGTCTFVITGKDKYFGNRTGNVKINGTAISGVKVNGSAVYDGTARTLENSKSITLVLKNAVLSEGKDFTVRKETYESNINAGTAYVTIDGIGAYSGTKKISFKIIPNTNEKTVTVSNAVYAKGGAIPTVTVNGLREGADYKVTFKNNKKVGTGTATITFLGNYKGSASVTRSFAITAQDLSSLQITAPDIAWTSKKGNYKSKITIYDTDGKALNAGTDYDKNIVYLDEKGEVLGSKDNVTEGHSVTAVLKGKGNYTGETSITYSVEASALDLSKAKIKVANKEYTGYAIKVEKADILSATIKSGKTTKNLEFGEDFEVLTYSNNVKKGTASVTFIGKGDITGTKTVSFKINQRSVDKHWLDVLREALGF